VNVLAQNLVAVATRQQPAPAGPRRPPAAGCAREPAPAAPRRLRNTSPREPPPAWDASRIEKLRLQLADLESELRSSAGLRHVLQQLSNAELTTLPLPGHGQTLTRWRALSEVAAHDLSLAQLFEAHADAIAIHDELARYALPLRGIWGAWTTEAGRVVIDGASDQPGVLITLEGWCGVSMQAARSVDVVFDRAVAITIGEPNGYGTRPGFWHPARRYRRMLVWRGGKACGDLARRCCA
jgi:hypothetical protein